MNLPQLLLRWSSIAISFLRVKFENVNVLDVTPSLLPTKLHGKESLRRGAMNRTELMNGLANVELAPLKSRFPLTGSLGIEYVALATSYETMTRQ